MPVIKQSTRSSNVIVSASGKSSPRGSSDDNSSSNNFKSQKEKEYKVKLPSSIFRSSFFKDVSNRTLSTSRNFIDAGVIRSDSSSVEIPIQTIQTTLEASPSSLNRALDVVDTTNEIFNLGIGEFDQAMKQDLPVKYFRDYLS